MISTQNYHNPIQSMISKFNYGLKTYSSYFRALRERRYKWEILEIDTNDVLDRALIKAKANKDLGAIDAPTYHMIADKINSLKKLRFTEDYENWKDKEMVEWMKYKVAAEVGGEE